MNQPPPNQNQNFMPGVIINNNAVGPFPNQFFQPNSNRGMNPQPVYVMRGGLGGANPMQPNPIFAQPINQQQRGITQFPQQNVYITHRGQPQQSVVVNASMTQRGMGTVSGLPFQPTRGMPNIQMIRNSQNIQSMQPILNVQNVPYAAQVVQNPPKFQNQQNVQQNPQNINFQMLRPVVGNNSNTMTNPRGAMPIQRGHPTMPQRINNSTIPASRPQIITSQPQPQMGVQIPNARGIPPSKFILTPKVANPSRGASGIPIQSQATKQSPQTASEKFDFIAKPHADQIKNEPVMARPSVMQIPSEKKPVMPQPDIIQPKPTRFVVPTETGLPPSTTPTLVTQTATQQSPLITTKPVLMQINPVSYISPPSPELNTPGPMVPTPKPTITVTPKSVPPTPSNVVGHGIVLHENNFEKGFIEKLHPPTKSHFIPQERRKSENFSEEMKTLKKKAFEKEIEKEMEVFANNVPAINNGYAKFKEFLDSVHLYCLKNPFFSYEIVDDKLVVKGGISDEITGNAYGLIFFIDESLHQDQFPLMKKLNGELVVLERYGKDGSCPKSLEELMNGVFIEMKESFLANRMN